MAEKAINEKMKRVQGETTLNIFNCTVTISLYRYCIINVNSPTCCD